MRPARGNAMYGWMGAALSCLVAFSLWAGEPTEVTRRHIEMILEVVRNPAITGQRQREEIRRIVDDFVDWREISRRVLGVHWRRLSPAQRREFTEAFRDFAVRPNMDKLTEYSGERIEYTGERVYGRYARVTLRVTTRNGEVIRAEVRLLRKDGRWGMYDLLIEGVSMVNNYRVQVNDILLRSSFEELIQRLRRRAVAPPRGA